MTWALLISKTLSFFFIPNFFCQNEPFYFALAQVAAWQDANGGCPWETCAYLQIHGMRTVTCPDYNVFMSSGLGKKIFFRSKYLTRFLKRPSHCQVTLFLRNRATQTPCFPSHVSNNSSSPPFLNTISAPQIHLGNVTLQRRATSLDVLSAGSVRPTFA